MHVLEAHAEQLTLRNVFFFHQKNAIELLLIVRLEI